MPRSKRRKRVIVDAGTQGPMIVGWAVLPIFLLVIGAVSMLWVCKETFAQVERFGGHPPSFTQLLVYSIVFVVGVSGLIVWLALRDSHRIAGPARRLKQSIERMRQGDLDFEVTLRDGDELTEVAHELNLLLAQMRQGETGGDGEAPASDDATDATDAEPAETVSQT